MIRRRKRAGAVVAARRTSGFLWANLVVALVLAVIVAVYRAFT